MRVGVLEIISPSITLNWFERAYDRWFRRRFASIAPQAVAIWCRQLGHNVHYATYYGQNDPFKLLPDSLDVVFIATCTNASAIAYALAKLFHRQKTITVIGGAHARSFPKDCLRFFDFVVKDCDKSVINNVLRKAYDLKTIVTSERPLTKIPSVEERLPEISEAHFKHGRRTPFSSIALYSSLGCPYHCDFCVDWNTPYIQLSTERLAVDLAYISKWFPGMLVQYHDPNFGVKFDTVMETIESVPGGERNPYMISSSLSVLHGHRLKRLKDTNCVFALIGIESWLDYSDKAGLDSAAGTDKLKKVLAHLKEIEEYIPNLQVTLLYGTDKDRGDEPVELTKEFIRKAPFAWPVINIPTAFGDTPLFQRYLAEGRLLESMPFSFYGTPYLTAVLKNYDPLRYYQNWMDIYKVAISKTLLMQRVAHSKNTLQKFFHLLRTMAVGEEYFRFRVLAKHLEQDREFRRYHEGKSKELPLSYRYLYRKRLGRYQDLITDKEMIPELESGAGVVSDS
jgi:hypothetical protein